MSKQVKYVCYVSDGHMFEDTTLEGLKETLYSWSEDKYIIMRIEEDAIETYEVKYG